MLAVKVRDEEYVLILCFVASAANPLSLSSTGVSSESLAGENTRDRSSMLTAGGGSR